MSALHQVEQLIHQVQQMSFVSIHGDGEQGPPVKQSKDKVWDPRVPIGHTAYSWGVAEQAPEEDVQEHKHVHETVPEPIASQEQSAAQEIPSEEQKEERKGQQKGKGKKQKKQKQKQPLKADDNQPLFSRLDIRVGRVVEAKAHPDADSLYLEQIDIGEDKPREIVSGLVKFVPMEEFVNTNLLVFANLKPSKLRGIFSYGMVFCASNDDHTDVQIIRPPEGAQIGERVTLEGEDFSTFNPDQEINGAPKKKNSAWMKVKPVLKTNGSFEACCDGKRFMTSKGPCVVKSLPDAQIS